MRVYGVRSRRLKGCCTLPAAAAMMSLAMASATAQAQAQAQREQAPTEQAQGGTPRSFAIPGQPLATALMEFAEQSGWQVSAHGDLVQGKASTGVSGTMTPEQAIARLLAGTGLVASVTGGNTVTVSGPAPAPRGVLQLDPVQVQGYPVPPQAMIDNLPPPYAGGQVATGGQIGLLGNRGVMDTPFNQTSYTAKKIQDQQARTVFDVLADDPSVRFGGSDLTQNSGALWIRGFPTYSSSILFGGLYGMMPYYSTMTELAERVELLRGPSAMLNGMTASSSNGGIVNVIPKRAPEPTLAQLTADYASGSQFGGHADLAHRFGADKQFGVRFNGVFRGGETPVQWNTNKRTLTTLGLDFRGERVRVSSDLGYQYQFVGGALPELALAPGVPLPAAPDARTSQGGAWGYIARKDAWAVVNGEVDLTDRITLYASGGVRDNRDEYQLPRSVRISNIDGSATASIGNLSYYFQNLVGTAGIRGLVDTGIIGHEFNVNATAIQQIFGVGFAFGTGYATNIYSPSYIPSPNIPTPQANISSITNLNSLAFADTLSLAGKRVQLTAGVRLQQVKSTNYNTTTGAQTSDYDQSAVTPSVALVLKPFWQNVSFYGNFIQGLQQGTVVSASYANAGEVFPPYVTTQFEAGIKIDWGKLTTTASVFQISQPSTIADVATNTLVLAGEQRNQGIELNFFGELAEGVRVLGGAMFLSGVLTKTQGGLTDGWIAPFAPGAQFNLGGEWDLPFARGLTALGRITYTGAQYIDTTAPRRSLPEWTRLDLGLRYVFDRLGPTGKPVALRFNVENVLDNDYWQGGSSASNLVIGAPRTFRLALTADF
ncbi:TonB-dependent siderophore receptor [Reyranella sp.]|uniref:TonB-dependent siderophore receptor n=1 Tax=Reyranella sp. TaxID=1929291 RepID=UPI003BA965C9